MDTTDRTATALERIAEALETIAGALTAPGAQARTQASTPAHMPTFAGYAASWTKDAAGNPSYIITADGEIADKHEKQGDVWYSVKDETAAGGYRRLLTIKAGETLPEQAQWTPPASREVRAPENRAPAPSKAQQAPQPATPAKTDAPPAGSPAPNPENRPSERPGDAQADHIDTAKQAAAAPQAKAPEAGNPFDELAAGTLRRLHALGRAVHGDDGWREIGPQRVQAHSDGRAERSDQLSHDEATRLINELQTALEKRNNPEYAG